MKINVFGLGYVGCVTAACLALDGHDVTGIDVSRTKVNLINRGKSPMVEPGLQDAIAKGIGSKRLKATVHSIPVADLSIICVGTPSNENGSLHLFYLSRVAEQMGEYIARNHSHYHVINIRSTVLPGTVEQTFIPRIEERSGRKAGKDFGVCMNPEFMRESTSIDDYFHPPFVVIGELDKKSGDTVALLYKDLRAPLMRTTIKVAEMVKYTCNAFHALKVVFANEIGNVCKNLDIDSHEVMDIFCKDTKLNISPTYFKPGFAFGGSCLPKDVRALLYKSREADIETPVLSSILNSNNHQIEVAYKLITKTGKKRVGILGLSFKPGTDDLRESPMVLLVEKLIGRGLGVSIYDKEVSFAKLFGANKQYIEKMIPHISSLIKDSVLEVIRNSQVIVIAKNSKEFETILRKIDRRKKIIDLVRVANGPEKGSGAYEGICW